MKLDRFRWSSHVQLFFQQHQSSSSTTWCRGSREWLRRCCRSQRELQKIHFLNRKPTHSNLLNTRAACLDSSCCWYNLWNWNLKWHERPCRCYAHASCLRRWSSDFNFFLLLFSIFRMLVGGRRKLPLRSRTLILIYRRWAEKRLNVHINPLEKNFLATCERFMRHKSGVNGKERRFSFSF